MNKSSPAFRALCRQYPEGLSAAQLLEQLQIHTGTKLSTPTLRKYVQLGLVERSRRSGVGQQQGSVGSYAPTALLQLVRLRQALKTTDGPVLLFSPTLALLQQCEAAQTAADRLMRDVRLRAKAISDVKKRQRILKVAKVGDKAVKAALQGLERELGAI